MPYKTFARATKEDEMVGNKKESGDLSSSEHQQTYETPGSRRIDLNSEETRSYLGKTFNLLGDGLDVVDTNDASEKEADRVAEQVTTALHGYAAKMKTVEKRGEPGHWALRLSVSGATSLLEKDSSPPEQRKAIDSSHTSSLM